MALVGLFFLVPRAGAAELSAVQRDEFFRCGLLGGCLDDFAVIRRMSAEAAQVAQEIARGSGENAPGPGEPPLRSKVVEIQDALDRCNRDVLSQCKVDLSKAREMIADKVRFLGDPHGKEDFEWSEENKKLYVDTFLRKLCSGSVSMAALESYNGVLFFNTRCTGTKYLRELPAFQGLVGIGFFEGPQVCDGGLNTQAIVTMLWEDHSANYVVVTSSARTGGWKREDRVVDSLDDTLVHEFVHRQRNIDPEFKRSTDEFISFRYERLRDEYRKKTDELEADVNAEAERIAEIPDLTDDQRDAQVKEWMHVRLKELREWMIRERVPVEMGFASSNGAWGAAFAPDQPGVVNLRGLPWFKDGKPTRYHFVDWMRSGVSADQKSISIYPLDSYALFSPEEYVAVTLSLYRTDPNTAREKLSEEELRWLEDHWKFGYLKN